ncbi:hypothetical protein HETIRDRAFT_307013 [Heterobasidion irregulare TC 32-1]|uniref:Uncharacterized protein n=1 Tax=Heterobasidion irregulare (strain TC 32-1) TaxID=747525 RepID=W4KL21_HETIT|nr:uncharacterized protein HETIRDRAFT_307013 [Heterobasidion irregulare TC 32-1]ETW86522.1 hypothetical protein HETIRDRAFT_307013 [Heterobasidion irregulare TC 32-1]
MGIIGSLPSRWSSAAGSGGDSSSLDVTEIHPHFEDHKNICCIPPSTPLAANSKAFSNTTSRTLIGSSPSKTDSGSTGSLNSTSQDSALRSEGSRHTCNAHRPVNSDEKSHGRKRSIEPITSVESNPTKKRRIDEALPIQKTKEPNTFAPFASTSKSSSTDTTSTQAIL